MGGVVAAVELRRERAWFNPDLTSRDYNVPAAIGAIILLASLLLTSLAVARANARSAARGGAAHLDGLEDPAGGVHDGVAVIRFHVSGGEHARSLPVLTLANLRRHCLEIVCGVCLRKGRVSRRSSSSGQRSGPSPQGRIRKQFG